MRDPFLPRSWRTASAWLLVLAGTVALAWAGVRCFAIWGPTYAGILLGNLAGGWLLAGLLYWPGVTRLRGRGWRTALAWAVLMACPYAGHALAGFVAQHAPMAAQEAAQPDPPGAQLALIEASGTLAAQQALTGDIETLTSKPWPYTESGIARLPSVRAMAFFDGKARAAFGSFYAGDSGARPIFLSTAYLDAMQPAQTRAVVGHELWHILNHPRKAQADARRRDWMAGGLAVLLMAGLAGLACMPRGGQRASLMAACLGVALAAGTLAGVAWAAHGQRQEELDADAFGARVTRPVAMGGALTAIYSACSKTPAPDVRGRSFLDDHPDWHERMLALGLDPAQACKHPGPAGGP